MQVGEVVPVDVWISSVSLQHRTLQSTAVSISNKSWQNFPFEWNTCSFLKICFCHVWLNLLTHIQNITRRPVKQFKMFIEQNVNMNRWQRNRRTNLDIEVNSVNSGEAYWMDGKTELQGGTSGVGISARTSTGDPESKRLMECALICA